MQNSSRWSIILTAVVLATTSGCKPASTPTDAQQATPTPAAAAKQVKDVAIKKSDEPKKEELPGSVDPVAWRLALDDDWIKLAKTVESEKALVGQPESVATKLLGFPSFRAERIIYSFHSVPLAKENLIPSLVVNMGADGKVKNAGLAGSRTEIDGVRFVKKLWEEGNDVDRMAMASYLERRGRLAGRTRKYVLDMLGEPSREQPPLIFYYVQTRDDDGKGKYDASLGKLKIDVKDGVVEKITFIGPEK